MEKDQERDITADCGDELRAAFHGRLKHVLVRTTPLRQRPVLASGLQTEMAYNFKECQSIVLTRCQMERVFSK
jgi:hypothetical protein